MSGWSRATRTHAGPRPCSAAVAAAVFCFVSVRTSVRRQAVSVARAFLFHFRDSLFSLLGVGNGSMLSGGGRCASYQDGWGRYFGRLLGRGSSIESSCREFVLGENERNEMAWKFKAGE